MYILFLPGTLGISVLTVVFINRGVIVFLWLFLAIRKFGIVVIWDMD